jgi:hypothetical protein
MMMIKEPSAERPEPMQGCRASGGGDDEDDDD